METVKMKRRDFLASSANALAVLATSRLGAVELKGEDQSVTLTAVGDCIITRRVSNIRDRRFLEIVKLLRDSDCALGNCEMTFGDAARLEPAPKGIDINLICEPFGADELAWIGLDLVGCAHNHALDYGSAGLISTLEHLNRVGIVSAGSGTTLARAARPAYADTPVGRIALVSCASTFPEWSIAEDVRVDSNGRAGINPLRSDLTYHLDSALFEQLKNINAALFPNASASGETDAASGKELRFLDQRFVSGKTAVAAAPHPADVVRVIEAVKIARRNARLVCVLIHEHGTFGPGGFLQTFAHACIDAGADFFFGAGPHVLGGIEIYRGRPICYSLGNFFFQYDTIQQIPAEVYEAYGLDIHTPDPSRGYDMMSERYFNKDRAYWESVVPRLTFNGMRLAELTLHPIILGFEHARYARGLPLFATNEEGMPILSRLKTLSEPYGTAIEIRCGIGVVKI